MPGAARAHPPRAHPPRAHPAERLARVRHGRCSRRGPAGTIAAMSAEASGRTPQGRSLGWVVPVAAAVAVRPTLWATALRQVGRLAPAGWWRRAPHLPLPDPAYLRFRLVTAYGGDGRPPSARDVVTYLHWCRGWPHVTAPR
jgi:hypothetical protein